MSKQPKASFVDKEKTSKKSKTKTSAKPPKSKKLEAKAESAASPASPEQMMQMMQQMMQMMSSSTGQQWESAVPFTPAVPEPASHEIVFPNTLERGIVTQEAIDIHPLYSKLFVTHDGELLGGLPAGCTITITGPPYIGKTRSAMEMMVRALEKGLKVGYVVAEEGFYDENQSGRNDLFSRFLTLGASITGLTEAKFRKKHDDNYIIAICNFAAHSFCGAANSVQGGDRSPTKFHYKDRHSCVCVL